MIRYFAAHPTAANLLMLGVLILGIVAAPGIKRETMPEIPPDEIEVRVEYRGAAPSKVFCQTSMASVELRDVDVPILDWTRTCLGLIACLCQCSYELFQVSSP